MIEPDCISAEEMETVLERLNGPDSLGRSTLFAYWIGAGCHALQQSKRLILY
jgi:hypothetical protein